MLVDRSRFLKLAVAIAATTTTTVACSAQDQGEDIEAGDGQAITAGGACGRDSITAPNGGASAMKPYAFQEGFCFDLAVHQGPALRRLDGPTAEASTIRFFDFIYDQCRMYSNQLRPAVAERVKSCLAKANDARPRNAEGVATEEFDATKMYDCGRDALEAICKDGIDQRLSRTRCQTIARILASDVNNAVDLRGRRIGEAALEGQCMAVFSGMKSSARQQVEDCVKNEKFDLYTCVEGIRSDFELAEAGETAVPEEMLCVKNSALGAPPAASLCDDVLAKAKRESETKGQFYVPEYTKTKCEAYRTKLAPPVAKKAIDCLLDQDRYTYDNIYACGNQAMKSACRDTGVDAMCKEILATVEQTERTVLGHGKPEINKGGRLTRQCRTLLSGLKPTTRTEVKRCVGPLAQSFAEADRSSGGDLNLLKYTLHSCVEGI